MADLCFHMMGQHQYNSNLFMLQATLMPDAKQPEDRRQTDSQTTAAVEKKAADLGSYFHIGFLSFLCWIQNQPACLCRLLQAEAEPIEQI